jgi:clan AA aspartic protease (TIGR02281 family)
MRIMKRFVIMLLFLAATGGVVLAYGNPGDIAKATQAVGQALGVQISSVQVSGVQALGTQALEFLGLSGESKRTAEIARGNGGDFSLHAKINGINTPMVIDTGATWVVLTYETAKAAGIPLELLDYNVDLATANGHTRAARLTLDRLAIGNLVERSVPALVVPRGQMKTSLLGMSFLDRLESWEVRSDKLLLRGYP